MSTTRCSTPGGAGDPPGAVELHGVALAVAEAQRDRGRSPRRGRWPGRWWSRARPTAAPPPGRPVTADRPTAPARPDPGRPAAGAGPRSPSPTGRSAPSAATSGRPGWFGSPPRAKAAQASCMARARPRISSVGGPSEEQLGPAPVEGVEHEGDLEGVAGADVAAERGRRPARTGRTRWLAVAVDPGLEHPLGGHPERGVGHHRAPQVGRAGVGAARRVGVVDAVAVAEDAVEPVQQLRAVEGARADASGTGSTRRRWCR